MKQTTPFSRARRRYTVVAAVSSGGEYRLVESIGLRPTLLPQRTLSRIFRRAVCIYMSVHSAGGKISPIYTYLLYIDRIICTRDTPLLYMYTNIIHIQRTSIAIYIYT